MKKLYFSVNRISVKIIFTAIVIFFVLNELSNYLIIDSRNYVVKVNGQKISSLELEQAMQNVINLRQLSTQEQFYQATNEEEEDLGNLRQKVLSQLIDHVLLYQYADKLGLTISDDQIKKAIFSIPAFRTKNKFDNEKFLYSVENMGLFPDQYAELLKKNLLIQKVIKNISDTNFLLPSEIDRLLALTLQIRNARMVTFDVTSLEAEQVASQEEIYADYTINKSKYFSPELFKVSYIEIDAKNIRKKISASEQEIQSWYEHHQERFTVPERKKYSIIQSKTESDAKNWLKKLNKGIDFATIAKSYSTDFVSAKKGGDIGWISDVSKFNELKKANLTEKGQISDIIETSFGFLIVRLDDIEPVKITPLSKVYHEVKAKVIEEKSIDAYYVLQKKVTDSVLKHRETLAFVEEISGIKAQETNWFDRKNMHAALNYDAIKKILFEGTPFQKNRKLGKNLDLITVGENHAFVIHIIDYCPEKTQPLENVQLRVAQEVRRKKAKEQARINAEKMLASIKDRESKNINNDEIELSNLFGLNFSQVHHFDSIYNQDDPLTQAVFTLPTPSHGKSSYGIASNAKGDIVLIALDSITPRLIGKEQRRFFIEKLNQEMIENVFSVLLTNLRTSAKIKIGAMFRS